MAATQVVPIGPHILPPPSILPRPDPWHPPHQSQPLFTPDPALTWPRFHGHQLQEYPIHSSPQSYHQPPPQLPRPTQQPVPPLDQLLQRTPYHSGSSGSSYAASYQQQDSRRHEQPPDLVHHAHSEPSAMQHSMAHAPFETTRQPSSRDEARSSTRALPSPSRQQLHRGSIGSQHSSTTSSSGYGGAQAQSTPPGALTLPVQGSQDM